MNVLALFFSKYLLFFKIGAGIVLLLGYLWAWNAFTERYVDRGRAEVQALWDAQKAVDEKEKRAAIDAARAKESLHNVEQLAILNKLYEESNHEIQARDRDIAALRADTRRLRTYTSRVANTGVSGTGSNTSGDHGTCTYRLPQEIGREFQALREEHIRITSEANKVARRLTAAQHELLLDRKTCNGAR